MNLRLFNIHFSFLLKGAVPQLEDKGKSIDSGEDDVEVPILCIKPLFGTVFNFVLLLKITPMVIFGNWIMKQPTLYRILFLQTNKNKFICPIHWNRPSLLSSFLYQNSPSLSHLSVQRLGSGMYSKKGTLNRFTQLSS